nr:condensation domain-containing protein [Kibdelosporangium sp. MJ126-NF4]CEL14235.1 Mannopeptimycin peptide synthetase MppB [Kibdelosporangium sp. MJ126-NF4]CTQ88603.1 Mannopeptimycin peptide synthetase MppB [Kibdelosporangium sp. MJ126-NF4]
MTGTPLSFNQEFLLAFDNGDKSNGAFGERHTLVNAWRLTGPVDLTALRQALDDVVARHDVLRTTLDADSSEAGGGHQTVHPMTSADLTVRSIDGTDRDHASEALLNEVDAEPFDVRDLPLLRAVLGRFDENDSVLVLATHHAGTDGWSMGILVRDLAACYTARLTGRPADLPQAPQYTEFASWQRQFGSPTPESVEYWRGKLAGAGMLGIPTDRPYPAGTVDVYAAHRFVIDDELSGLAKQFARSMRSTLFMVLLAAHQTQLRDMTGVAEVMIPTFTSGRYDERFTDTVGPFFNLLPLLTDMTGVRHLRDAVGRVRTTCLEAYANDIPFGDIVSAAPQITKAFGDPHGSVVAFEVLQHPDFADNLVFGAATAVAIRDRRLSQSLAASIPNGGVWALEVLRSGRIAGSLKYNRNTFDDDTIVGIADDFQRRLRSALT